MANHFSAMKRTRQERRRTAVNRDRKTRLRHQIRTLRRLLDQKDTAGAQKLLPETFSLIDRSMKWGIIKPNTAARYKSRLAVRVQSPTASA